MEKFRPSASERIKTILITILTLSMLLLAGIYIGGAQFLSGGNSAIRASSLPSGTVPLGEDALLHQPVYEKNLLPVAFAGIRYGGEGGGAYGTEQAAQTLFTFAAEPIHLSLAKGATLAPVSAKVYTDAASGNFLCLNLLSALPYQMLYALTGEFSAPAGSSVAISADRLLLSFAEDGRVTLYLSDGHAFYQATGDAFVKPSELAAMAHDSRLADFSMTENGTLLSAASPRAPKLFLQTATLSEAQYASVLPLFGYKAEASLSPLTADTSEGFTGTAVAPHGTLHTSGEGLLYTAARDSGIPLSDFLDTAKNELDIDMYDILLACVSLAEQLREIAPEAFGGKGSLYLSGFYRAEDLFTVQIGLCSDSIAVRGDAYPYFAKLTVQGGMFKSIDVRSLALTKNTFSGVLFPSLWQYRYAAENASVDTLRLLYRADALSDAACTASWYFTGTVQDTEVTP